MIKRLLLSISLLSLLSSCEKTADPILMPAKTGGNTSMTINDAVTNAIIDSATFSSKSTGASVNRYSYAYDMSVYLQEYENGDLKNQMYISIESFGNSDSGKITNGYYWVPNADPNLGWYNFKFLSYTRVKNIKFSSDGLIVSADFTCHTDIYATTDPNDYFNVSGTFEAYILPKTK